MVVCRKMAEVNQIEMEPTPTKKVRNPLHTHQVCIESVPLLVTTIGLLPPVLLRLHGA